MNSYKGWPLHESMPDGWKIDKTAGSPLSGYEFATNGKSILSGGKRALVRVRERQASFCLGAQKVTDSDVAATPKPNTPPKQQDPGVPMALNKLARERMKLKLLADIQFDLQVCEIEGWNKTEYIQQIRDLVNGIAINHQ